MPDQITRDCQCANCQSGTDHPEKRHHQQVNLFLAMLNRQQRKLFAAIESDRRGRGGDRQASEITGLSEQTIRSGRTQMNGLLDGRPLKKPVWRAGRPRTEVKNPAIIDALEALLADDVAGDPMNEKQWVRSSLSRLASQLTEQGFPMDKKTVWRILRGLGFSLKFNAKRRKGFGFTTHPERDEQFKHIASQRKEFAAAGPSSA